MLMLIVPFNIVYRSEVLTEDIAGEPVHEIYVIQVGNIIHVTGIGTWTYKINKTLYRWDEICIHMYW